MEIIGKGIESHTYDAIVIGSGLTGGWAAKELTQKGLRTLMVERGHQLEHIRDYKSAMKRPWELKHRGQLTTSQKKLHEFLKHTPGFDEATADYWFNDSDAPYEEIQRFLWMRPNIVGGKSVMWGRQSYRFSDLDFEANARDGHGIDWPIRYKDIEPWYDYVEAFVGISGQREGYAPLPDGIFLPPMEMNAVEKEVKKGIEGNFRNRIMTIGRVANLTQRHNNRGPCMFRNLCSRGCPFSGYFSTQSATLPPAMATGKLTMITDSIVSEIIYDKEKERAAGIRIIDAKNNKVTEFFSKIIFLNASTIGSTFILLNSRSDRFPNGLGNDSDVAGHYLMDHQFRCGAFGETPGFEDKYYYGRRPNGIYIPRFRNVKDNEGLDFVRGFGYQGGASREDWKRGIAELGIGRQFRERLTEPGIWKMGIAGFGECLPYKENQVFLDKNKSDKWGLPTIAFDAGFKENEKRMRRWMKNDAAEMLDAAGLKNIRIFDDSSVPGQSIHEIGTIPMGKDPKTSVLNKWNQMHSVKNVFVTDGSCMCSSGCQNPSLTFMALTARACDHAVGELKKMNI